MNTDLMRRIVEQIEATPERWDQNAWFAKPDANDCKTTFCVAGWAAVLEGYVEPLTGEYTDRGRAWAMNRGRPSIAVDWEDWEELGAELLALSADQADDLFATNAFGRMDEQPVAQLRSILHWRFGFQFDPIPERLAPLCLACGSRNIDYADLTGWLECVECLHEWEPGQ